MPYFILWSIRYGTAMAGIASRCRPVLADGYSFTPKPRMFENKCKTKLQKSTRPNNPEFFQGDPLGAQLLSRISVLCFTRFAQRGSGAPLQPHNLDRSRQR